MKILTPDRKILSKVGVELVDEIGFEPLSSSSKS